MQINVFAIRFTGGTWKKCEHYCSQEEADAVIESARAKAFESLRYQTPQYADYLAGAAYVFNVAYGLPDKPAEGDMLVVGVQVDGKTVRYTTDVEHLLERR